MRGFLYIGALVVTLFVATSVHANPTSVTTCTENALGDQTCTTVTTTTTTTTAVATTLPPVITAADVE